LKFVGKGGDTAISTCTTTLNGKNDENVPREKTKKNRRHS